MSPSDDKEILSKFFNEVFDTLKNGEESWLADILLSDGKLL
jgi:hypothetical protein